MIALRDMTKLAWGATGLGVEQNGDLLHFDCRREGIGKVIAHKRLWRSGADSPNLSPKPQRLLKS